MEPADLPVLFEHQRDPEGSRMAAFTPRHRDAFMEHWAKILGDETALKKTVLVDGQVAGNVVSFEMEGEREVGYWIGREHWGRGVATRALSQFLDHEKARPLYAHVAKHNVGSIRVLEKCGFTMVREDSRSGREGGDEVQEFVLVLRT